MIDTCVVIHWWNDDLSIKPYADRANPVVLAAATVRAHHPKLPIYVVDVSGCNRPDSDWLYFPEKLDFRILKRESYLREFSGRFDPMCNMRLYSRVWDVELAMRGVPEHVVIFLDADIFCLRPFPQVVPPGTLLEHFHANNNNGVWIYDKRSMNAGLLFDAWKGMLCRSLHDADFRREIHAYNPGYGTYTMQDEIVYRTAIFRMQNHVRKVPDEYNYLFQWLYRSNAEQIARISGLHCVSYVTGTDRRKLFLILDELWEQVIQVFDQRDLDLVFDKQRPDETMSLEDFYCNDPGVIRFAELAGITPEPMLYYSRQMKKDAKVRLSLL